MVVLVGVVIVWFESMLLSPSHEGVGPYVRGREHTPEMTIIFYGCII